MRRPATCVERDGPNYALLRTLEQRNPQVAPTPKRVVLYAALREARLAALPCVDRHEETLER
jgi:hypothetical protein